jgi:hypothetical protein
MYPPNSAIVLVIPRTPPDDEGKHDSDINLLHLGAQLIQALSQFDFDNLV